mgnify:CR=1 FL=1
MQQNNYDIEKIFEEIENELISSMKRTLWSHKKDEETKGFDWPQWQALKLKHLEDFRKNNKDIFKKYNKDIDYATKKEMKKQFREGASRTNKGALKAGIIKKEDSQLSGSFFGLNDRKIKALMKSTTNDINDVKYAALRMADDQYRQIIYKAEVFANTGAKTVKQAIDMATHDFLTRGFNCIEYSNGSRHNIADYCDMAIRTANKRANLMGEGEMRKKLGNPLVYISRHNGACDKCSPWQGRVYIDDVYSGGTKEAGQYPLLSTAIEGGLFHPRCQHGSSTYYPDINDEPEEVTKAFNNSEHEDAYTQALQRQKRQYERLALGSLLPKNVSNYQSKVLELQNQIEGSTIENKEDLNQYTPTRLLEKLKIDLEEYKPFGKYDPFENDIQEQASKLLKMDKLPKISKKAYINSKGKEVVRVVHSYHGKTANEAYENTIKGKIQYSENTNSSFGRGIYFGDKSVKEDIISSYSGRTDDVKIINAKINENAKILEFKNQMEYLKDLNHRLSKVPDNLKKIYQKETSLLYMLDGIDGIMIKSNQYYCIYNRGVLIIDE